MSFEVGSIDALLDASDSIGGVLAWYSLIHHEPSTIYRALGEFARVLRPGGGLLLGFFVGSDVEAFDHAIVKAYRWSVEALVDELRDAGFRGHRDSHSYRVPLPPPTPRGDPCQLANAR